MTVLTLFSAADTCRLSFTKDHDPASIRASLESLECDTMGKTWFEILKPQFEKPYFLEVCRI